jgi:type IV pilus assembly protein PilE
MGLPGNESSFSVVPLDPTQRACSRGTCRSRRTVMKSIRGITLIELLVVMVIVGILAAIAVPAYTGHMVRARRADAKTSLEQLRAAQEMRRAEYGSYSNDLAALQTSWGGPAGALGMYTIGLAATATTFTGTAAPLAGSRQEDDGALTIDQNGTKLPADKWAK